MSKHHKPFLSDPPPPPAPARPKTVTDRVRDFFVEAHKADPLRWWTLNEIAGFTGLTVSQVNGAVYGLVGLHAVQPKLTSHAGRRKQGQAYRWKDGPLGC